MAEDWGKIAAEVHEALKSVADISQPNGFPATLRIPAGGAPTNPWDPPSGVPTYHHVIVVLDEQELRDINGTLIGTVARKAIMSGAAGVEPSDDDKIHLGAHLTYVDATAEEAVVWDDITSVLHVAPAGVAVMYELLLAS